MAWPVDQEQCPGLSRAYVSQFLNVSRALFILMHLDDLDLDLGKVWHPDAVGMLSRAEF